MSSLYSALRDSSNHHILELRLRLLRMGYQPIPLIGKDPKVYDWQDGEIDEQRIRDQHQRYNKFLNTGLRTGELVVVDIDLYPVSHTDRLREIAVAVLGATPLERFGSKGAALLYRNSGDIIKKINIRARLPDDEANRHGLPHDKPGKDGKVLFPHGVEILGWHTQVAAFGRHPKTGNDYQWVGAGGLSPLDVAFAELPEVSPGQLNEFAAQVAAELPLLGYVLPTGETSMGGGLPDRVTACGRDEDAEGITELFLARLPPTIRIRNGYHEFDCPCCGGSEGGGFTVTAGGGWYYHCWKAKCDYASGSGWEPGWNITDRHRSLFAAFGGDPDDLPRSKSKRDRYYDGEWARMTAEIEEMDGADNDNEGMAKATDHDNPFREDAGDDAGDDAGEADAAVTIISKWFRTRAGDRTAPPPTWVIDQLIEECTDCMIEAPKQHLKSFLALDIAYAVATGTMALGKLRVIQPGPVIYWCGEGYHDIIARRATAWEIAHGYQPYEVADIIFINTTPNFNQPAQLDAQINDVKKWLGRRRVALHVIDTLNRSLNGEDEDRATTASKYFAMLKSSIREQLGGATLTVHHMGKDGARGGRGSSAFEANMDTVLVNSDHTRDEDGNHTFCMTVRYQKSAPDGDQYWLRSHFEETPAGPSLVLDLIDEPQGGKDNGNGHVRGVPKETEPTALQMEAALLDLNPHGGVASTIDVCNKLARMIYKKAETIKKYIVRNREPGQKFHRYYRGEGEWCIPGEEFKSCGSSLNDQLKHTRH